jgi:hypothetical protein
VKRFDDLLEYEFSKTFEEWYEDWFKKPFPTDKDDAEELKADYDLQSTYEYCCKRKISVEKEIENAIKVLMDNRNLFFKSYEGRVSPISYCEIDNDKIVFKE